MKRPDCILSDREVSDARRDAENLREALRYMRLEYLERLEARYAKNPRECIL